MEAPAASGNWIVDILNGALQFWSGVQTSAQSILTTTPRDWGGDNPIFSVISGINMALIGIAYGLLLLFF